MKFSLLSFLLFTSFFCIACIQLFLVEAAITCLLDGVCRYSAKNDHGTVCSNCKSCTFKNCCNKVYTSVLAKCNINGWKAKDYRGNVPVDIGAPKKRDAGCSKDNHCPRGYKCVAYKKGDDKGFCWRGPQGDGGPSLLAFAIALAGLIILV